jgi:uncharacterized protein YeeX (DUF496 family)
MNFTIGDENEKNAFFGLMIETLAQTMTMQETFGIILSLNQEQKSKINDQVIQDLLDKKRKEWRQKIKERLFSEFGEMDLKELF